MYREINIVDFGEMHIDGVHFLCLLNDTKNNYIDENL